ncbi:collagen alpha-1(I) chain-like [Panthera tigris]|uniref:collagen alpha-1(I) chain-like n=1 Tax=Panthera tigris TaxID=9694 RepID=UPI001C6FB217|nr:collagen alpha-1(I) chain-like [Panthera tigris]
MGLGRAGRTRVSSSPGHSGNRGSGRRSQRPRLPACRPTSSPRSPGPPAPGVPVDLERRASGSSVPGVPFNLKRRSPACRSTSSPRFPVFRSAVCWSTSSAKPRRPRPPACWSTSSAEPRVPGRRSAGPRSPVCWSTSTSSAEPRASGSSATGVLVGPESPVPRSPGPPVPRSPGVLVDLESAGPQRAGRPGAPSPGAAGPRSPAPGVLVDLESQVPGPPVRGVLVDLERGVAGPRCAGRPRVPRLGGPRPPAPGVLVSLRPACPRLPACWSTSSAESPVRGVLVYLGRRAPSAASQDPQPQVSGRPVRGFPACWSASSAEPRGPRPLACRSASNPASPGFPVRVSGSSAPSLGSLVDLGSRVAKSPGLPVRGALVDLESRAAAAAAASPPPGPHARAYWSTSKRPDLDASGRPRQREGLLVDPVLRKKEKGEGRKDSRPEPAGPPFPGPRRRGRAGPGRTGRPSPGRAHPPLGKGATRPPPQRRPRADGTATTRRAPPSPSQPGARRPRRGGGPAGRKPPRKRADAPGGAPPLSARTPTLAPPLKAAPRPSFPKGRDAHAFPAGRPGGADRGGRARETRQPLRRAERARGAEGDPEEEERGGPAGERRRGRIRTDGRTEAGASRAHGRAPFSLPPLPSPSRQAPAAAGTRGGTTGRGRAGTGHDRTGQQCRSDKPLCRGLTFNRSQRGSCSATYETPTQKQVVYEWFSTRFPTNVRCVTGEGAAPFPAAPRFPGRGALRTGPRSRRAAGHATPRGARAAARRRGRRGTGYPRPTEAPRRCRIVPPGRDSDLEAFSHNPTDGSFAPLAPQPSTYTKCLNLRFLSY